MSNKILGERYLVEEQVGRGNMATVYRGRDMRTDHVVAVKVLREHYSTDPEFVRSFLFPARVRDSLHHPNIVRVYGYGQTDGMFYIIREFVEGTDLRRYLRSHGVLNTRQAVHIARTIALALGAIHKCGIVHGRIFPQAILSDNDGSFKLTDMGFARILQEFDTELMTNSSVSLLLVGYSALEQLQGETIDFPADIYAVGIVMYEMLTGRTPFDGDTPVTVAMQHIQDIPTPPSYYNPSISRNVEEIILRCLEKKPNMRFHDGADLACALEPLL